MKRDIITIGDLSNREIEEVFDLADRYLAGMAETKPYQIRGKLAIANRFLMTSLFYEPSTRTRFSFEAAMTRLGGTVLGAVDPATSSAAKGESILDTGRVMENYADIIVLRHPAEGAARALAEHVEVPVINGGDGRHEHPTQTLCDLYTLRRENKTLKDLNVLLVGDLKNGRTVHSLVFALARFKSNIITMPAKGLELPESVSRRLREEYGVVPMPRDAVFDAAQVHRPPVAAIDVVYVAPGSSLQQQTAKGKIKIEGEWENFSDAPTVSFDVCYVTRLQGERLSPGARIRYPVIDRKFLKDKEFADTKVLHPLPRVNELDADLDADPRAVYFKQAAYGVPVRMALIAKVLGLAPFEAPREAAQPYPIHSGGPEIVCANEKCITRLSSEKNQLRPKFWMVKPAARLLRCCYCESEFALV
jgi:aspartate carbamoyltransferase catalytic subunit